MIVLALDTALSATSVAVLRGDRTLAALSEPMERGHQERLAGLVRMSMRQAQTGFDALDRIAVTVGPGSFTGLRVGLAFAKGLSLALDIPCVGVGTLTVLAAGAKRTGQVVAVIDARRGQLYTQVFKDGAPRVDPQSLTLDHVQDLLRTLARKGPVTLVGSGSARLESEAGVTTVERLWPDPIDLARLGMQAPAPTVRPRPLYLRAPDAKTIAERKNTPR